MKHIRMRWPEAEVPPGEPMWLLYELNEQEDAVVRSVDLFPDGTITRNSIAIEESGGKPCPSLIDCPIAEGFAGTNPEEIPIDEFEKLWMQGTDKPFWNVP